MKTAILISGHMRTFDRCLPTQHWHVFRHFPGADFFVSTVDDADAKKAELLRVKYPGARVEIEAVKEQPDCVAEMRAKSVELPAEWTKGKPYTHEPYAISVHPQAVLRQLWQLQMCAEMLNGKADEYGYIIRCRPDLWFHSIEIPHLGIGCALNLAWVPWWGRFGGINDRFAILGRDAAVAYFTTYSQIPDLVADGCPIHPESLISASLEKSECRTNPLLAEFSTLRPNGEMRAPEISAGDIVRARA